MYAKFEKLLKEYNVTPYRVHKETGISTATLSDWKNGKSEPKRDKIEKICDYFNISISYFYGEEEQGAKYSNTKGTVINVLGRVAAGIPIEAVEDIIDTEEISLSLARTGDFFGLRIHGDSMEPKMSEGDIVIVRQQDDAESGDTVIVTINGTDATCKRLRKYRDGIELISTNPSYEPIFFSNEDIANKPVKVIGKVVELRAKF